MLDGPFRGTDALAAGLLTHRQLYGPRYRRLFPDVFVPVGLELDLRNRSRAAYLLVRGRGALGGYSAAIMLGVDCGPAHPPAELVTPGSARAHPGLRIHRAGLPPGDLTVVDGCRVTTALRTAWDLARRLEIVEAVVAVDALARRRFAPADLLARRTEQAGARNCRRLDEIVALADPRAESPPETRLRVELQFAGLPSPEVQYEFRDEYGFTLARFDLAYPATRLAIEYDGAGHFSRQRHRRDRQRDAELATYGWYTLRLVDDDLVAIPQTTRKIETLLRQRRAHAWSDRAR